MSQPDVIDCCKVRDSQRCRDKSGVAERSQVVGGLGCGVSGAADMEGAAADAPWTGSEAATLAVLAAEDCMGVCFPEARWDLGDGCGGGRRGEGRKARERGGGVCRQRVGVPYARCPWTQRYCARTQ